MVHPPLDRLGGIESYYLKVLPRLGVPAESFPIGRSAGDRRRAGALVRPIADWLRLRRRLDRGDVAVVLFNPSLKLDMVVREGLMHRLAKSRGCRTVVFWRGWQPRLALRIERSGGAPFRWLFGGADAFVVLAEEFAESLARCGLRQPVHREVTVVDDDDVVGIDREALLARRISGSPRAILFLARLLREKGIHETIEAVARLEPGRVELLVAGDGPERESASAAVARRGLANVRFLGHVSGAAKRELLERASLLCLPTRHGEGLPNSVVEAMAFGLPIVTARAGGITDFFRDEVHGFALAAPGPAAIARAIGRLLDDEALYRRVALTNFAFARERFLASDAAARLAALYRSLQNNGA